MFEYKTELLETSVKWTKDGANEKDLLQLDALLNLRAKEGWELVTHGYMPILTSSRSAFLITFRKTL
ncbi:DUF4177 domain-containing protein [Vagococcus sp. BWB3-3]|uniref:DUF4177 domain-containing protein n=1 Tax=Vagococcus allomyrinae TaxID=2794353 RepID=A0A940SUL1_9ENTE|nr:DUF4177 domain-containing protein [Vagococcus allomyrinae]MBP1040919.1 DUF4177 domain-containing protein [Vagococcus allomyrinae]